MSGTVMTEMIVTILMTATMEDLDLSKEEQEDE